ncbi:MAG: PAS domain S-box protein [Gallionellaceae bacterium]|nr:PAS domain S-box protein [Gallionellaceae bacterium]
MTLRLIWLPITLWLFILIIGGYALQQEHLAALASLTRQTEVGLQSELRQIGSALSGSTPTADDGQRFRQMALPPDATEAGYYLINRQHVVLASNRSETEGHDIATQFNAQVLAAIRLAGSEDASVVSQIENGLVGIRPLRSNSGSSLLIQRDLTQQHAQLLKAYHNALFNFAVLTLIGIALLFLFSTLRINRQLRVIGKTISRFAAGDGSARSGLAGHDSISRLGRAFDNMASRIGQERSNLAESEERLKFALHGSNAGIWDWLIDSGHTYYSPRWKSLLGYDEHELLAHSEEWLKRVHPDDLARVMALLNAHMTGASAFFESEHRLRRKDNDYIWVLERGVALRDERARPYRMVGALTDISGRKEIESALQRSEEAYRSVVNAVTQVIFRSDAAGRLTFLNPAWADLTGIPVGTSLSRVLTDFVVAEDRDRARQVIAAANRGGKETVSCELRLTTRAGASRWFNLHVRSLQDDHESPGIAGLLTDIDALKMAQDALRQSNKERNTILDLSPDGYVFIDRDRQVVYVNPAFLAMTGTTGIQIIGKDLHGLEALIQSLCDPAKPLPEFTEARDDAEQLLHLNDPAKSILKWLIRHIRDRHGKLQAGVIFFRDVTAQVEIDRMKSEFLSTAAHELRTPMASIYGFAELLLAREFDAATQRDLLQRIHRQTRNLTNLVNELLDLARIEARGSKSFKFKEQELAPVVMNTLASFYVPHETHSLEVELPGKLAMVNLDADKFHQALLNVLGNALKYSPGGGIILVRSSERSEAGRKQVGVVIEDRGIGMTPEQMAHMFDRFYRADTSGAIPGTGLGMCLVKEIMGFFGGQVTVSSEIGHGTEVTLWLPIAATPSPEG